MIVRDKKNVEKGVIISFLQKIDNDFPIPLSKKVTIEEYAEKLLDKAEICVDVENNIIKGMVAGYTDNLINDSAYISLVGVLAEFRGNGIAKKLVIKFVETCKERSIKSINLYTHKTNISAIKMYEKLGFKIYHMDNETRKQDLHYILYLS